MPIITLDDYLKGITFKDFRVITEQISGAGVQIKEIEFLSESFVEKKFYSCHSEALAISRCQRSPLHLELNKYKNKL